MALRGYRVRSPRQYPARFPPTDTPALRTPTTPAKSGRPECAAQNLLPRSGRQIAASPFAETAPSSHRFGETGPAKSATARSPAPPPDAPLLHSRSGCTRQNAWHLWDAIESPPPTAETRPAESASALESRTGPFAPD